MPALQQFLCIFLGTIGVWSILCGGIGFWTWAHYPRGRLIAVCTFLLGVHFCLLAYLVTFFDKVG